VVPFTKYKSESYYEYIYQKLLTASRKKENDPRLKTTALNHKLFEVAYIKAFPPRCDLYKLS